MDHCSSHNKHLACDTANRPRSSTGSEPPYVREQDRAGYLMQTKTWSRKKTPPRGQMKTYSHADKGQFVMRLTEPKGIGLGTEIINTAMKVIQNRHLMASNFNMRHI